LVSATGNSTTPLILPSYGGADRYAVDLTISVTTPVPNMAPFIFDAPTAFSLPEITPSSGVVTIAIPAPEDANEADTITLSVSGIDTSFMTFDSEKREFSFDTSKVSENLLGKDITLSITVEDQYGASNEYKIKVSIP